MPDTATLSILGFTIGAYFIYSVLLFLLQEKLIFQKVKPNLLSYEKLRPLAVSLTARNITAPSLILLAEEDSIIPMSHSIDTLKNLANNKEFKKIPDCDHNDLFQKQDTTRTINKFITSNT